MLSSYRFAELKCSLSPDYPWRESKPVDAFLAGNEAEPEQQRIWRYLMHPPMVSSVREMNPRAALCREEP